MLFRNMPSLGGAFLLAFILFLLCGGLGYIAQITT